MRRNLLLSTPLSIRDRNILCIVESVEALSAFEASGIYNGIYHVLGNSASSIEDGQITDEDIRFMVKHVKSLKLDEVIIATSPKLEGDMLYYKIVDALKAANVKKISRIDVGLPVGSSIEMTDRITLHTALETRRRVYSE